MATPEQPPRAAALRYRKGESAPALVASGRGHVAAILKAAEEAGIPVREDAVPVEALARLDLGDRVPAELYQAVAEALAWAYRLTRR
jgi:flagellar biosynthesis protein